MSITLRAKVLASTKRAAWQQTLPVAPLGDDGLSAAVCLARCERGDDQGGAKQPACMPANSPVT
jgi:hypothetical protein